LESLVLGKWKMFVILSLTGNPVNPYVNDNWKNI
jgi:hypothetical protein